MHIFLKKPIYVLLPLLLFFNYPYLYDISVFLRKYALWKQYFIFKIIFASNTNKRNQFS